MTRAQWKALGVIKKAYQTVKIRNTARLNEPSHGQASAKYSINTDLGVDDYEIQPDGTIKILFDVAQ